jgi:hypothetical protein
VVCVPVLVNVTELPPDGVQVTTETPVPFVTKPVPFTWSVNAAPSARLVMVAPLTLKDVTVLASSCRDSSISSRGRRRAQPPARRNACDLRLVSPRSAGRKTLAAENHADLGFFMSIDATPQLVSSLNQLSTMDDDESRRTQIPGDSYAKPGENDLNSRTFELLAAVEAMNTRFARYGVQAFTCPSLEGSIPDSLLTS